jgi:hypothetical protein
MAPVLKGPSNQISRVVDPHWFNADPDPSFFLNVDPDPVPNPGFWWPKIGKKLQMKKIFFVNIVAQAAGEAFSPQKRTSSTSKHENSLLFFFICGSFLPTWIRIRILQLKLMRIHVDPDPD